MRILCGVYGGMLLITNFGHPLTLSKGFEVGWGLGGSSGYPKISPCGPLKSSETRIFALILTRRFAQGGSQKLR